MDQPREILQELKNSALNPELLTRALEIPGRKSFMPIFQYSAELCEKYFKKEIFVRGIIEFSNICSKNCFYCGIRAENKKLRRYTMTKDEIMNIVDKMHSQGVLTVVLQSGESPVHDELIIDTVREIKKKYDMAVTLSAGEKEKTIYSEFKKAGADRYLLRIETTDEKLYKKLHPDSSLKQRIKCLYMLKELGFETGTGIMTGLPGQSMRSIADDIMFFSELKPAMAGIGPFIPHKDTPLKNEKPRDIFLTLKTLALIRIALKNINLPATTAMGTLDKNGRIDAMKYGANVFMPNFTPPPYREAYMLYDNKICVNEKCGISCIKMTAGRAGKKTVISKGGYF
ncbi:MAG: [FeFe] hydrogenase H-cluster radical SAM maturase HydE [Candidatus Goldiibacteriota bacterium]